MFGRLEYSICRELVELEKETTAFKRSCGVDIRSGLSTAYSLFSALFDLSDMKARCPKHQRVVSDDDDEGESKKKKKKHKPEKRKSESKKSSPKKKRRQQ